MDIKIKIFSWLACTIYYRVKMPGMAYLPGFLEGFFSFSAASRVTRSFKV